jgi:hypothetical protein
LTVRAGLRGRFVAVLVLVSALTLAVAAVALFSPLDRLLRDDVRDTLAQTVRGELGDFTKLPASAVRGGSPELFAAMRPLRRTGAEVAVLDRRGRVLVTTDPDLRSAFAAAEEALRTGRERDTIVGTGADAEAQVAIPVKIRGIPAVIAARKGLDDVQDITGVVRRAFVVAAAAGCWWAGCWPGASPPGSGGCATPQSASHTSDPSRSSGPRTAATRSATSAGRSPSCRSSCASRNRRGARS